MYYDTISDSYLTITNTLSAESNVHFSWPYSAPKKKKQMIKGVHRQQGFLCIVSIYFI